MLALIEKHHCFGGRVEVYSHDSTATKSKMRFALFLPSSANKEKVPVLYWLSGLTCTEQNFITKSGALRLAEELGLAIVVPDTSPRGLNLSNDKDNYYFGEGAGFYLNAVEEPWASHYQMESYVANELPTLVSTHFPINPLKTSIFGHSMGGHGALTLAFKNPQQYQSVSAFAPICSTIHSPWGINALTLYLGEDKKLWQNYDAVALLENKGWSKGKILVDQGTQDEFLEKELKPNLLIEAAKKASVELEFNLREGYDHSFYFISSFIEGHLRFHHTILSRIA
ncbi:MAG: S-formylglutathione hydrolase [Proteobacteria bacterium]|nr:S-formylglutathione hydrolase [Pseudomonadota bacterium]